MKTPANLTESRKAIARNFKEIHGVSMLTCVKDSGLLVRLFGSSPKKVERDRVVCRDFGRGYPFWEEKRTSAEEADRRNLEILSKW